MKYLLKNNMKIKINIIYIMTSKILPYVGAFLLGGGIVGGAKAVGSFFPAEYASLIGGMPTGIIASFFMPTEAKKKEYFLGYMYSSAVITLSVIFIHLMTENTQMKVDLIAGMGYILWAVTSFLVIKYSRKGNTGKK
jgi:hypothetical protein